MENCNTITIRVNFKDRSEANLEQINALLAAMPLRELDLQDTAGYTAVTSNPLGRVISRRYGLDEATLICHLADEGEGFRYRIDTLVCDPAEDREKVLETWRQENPSQVVRILITTGTEGGLGCIIAHHRKQDWDVPARPSSRHRGLYLMKS